MGIKRIFSASGGLGKKVFSGGGPFSGAGLVNRNNSVPAKTGAEKSPVSDVEVSHGP